MDGTETANRSDKKFRLVQVGCGNMARRWVKYAAERPDIELAALVDIHLPAAEALAREFELNVPCYTDLGTAIRESGADLVFDVTIPQVHKTVVTTAAALGCDVIGEKPMAMTMADAYEIEDIVRRYGRRYSVMQNRRFARQIREARGQIAQGTIGKPAHATANFFLGPHFGGFRETMDHPLLLDMAIHTFDQARYLLQADPMSVYCHEFNPSHSWYSGNASAVCIFEMDDGSVFTYNGSWCAEGEPTSWQGDWRVVGSEGTLFWDGTNEPYCSVAEGSLGPGARMLTYRRVEPSSPWTGREGHDGCFDEMLDALRDGRPAETDCSDNLKSMAMVFAAIESARRGEKVRIGPGQAYDIG
ncbi:Gfo/Idh/MocA family protein [Cohnella sp. JJ-181]|uniref:Gfo/Idh/MocA family protein n=1 Tax=Cohnella rhizoplanae TaxID=2974897 RepID=UPI0022FFBC9A|nr:Gfo/Idh/MocA family oxidoreductase [Cohnella sp. JJ-181]CAI6087452.1 1,5-anhydro-D-fructose reductase [Cohnella sp. JJ-181]